MKTIIILGALLFSAGTFAQGRSDLKRAEKDLKGAQTEIKEKGEKVEKDVKDKVNQGKNEADKMKDQANAEMNKAKEKVNDGKAYGKDKVEMTGKEFGQNRAAEAKAKAKEVKSDAEAEEMIETSKAETEKTMGSIDEKLSMAREKLSEKLAAGELTKAEYSEKIEKLKEYEERKNAIVNSLK